MVARSKNSTRTVRALSLDSIACRLLTEDRAWTVHSVFARAANLRSDDGELVGLVLSPAPNGPATAVLTDDGRLEPMHGWLAIGDEVCPSRFGLDTGERPPPPDPLPRKRERGSRDDTALVLSIDGASSWNTPRLARSLDVATVLERAREAASVGARLATKDGLAPLLVSPLSCLRERGGGGVRAGDHIVYIARECVQAIRGGWLGHDIARFGEGCRRLSGLGPGLTPSGDDLLAGLALGLRAALGSLPVGIGEAIRDATVGRTTDLAAVRVKHAVEGHADEYVDAMLRAVVADADADLAGAVEKLLGYGHTSGADTLVGLLLGLRLALDAEPE